MCNVLIISRLKINSLFTNLKDTWQNCSIIGKYPTRCVFFLYKFDSSFMLAGEKGKIRRILAYYSLEDGSGCELFWQFGINFN